LADALKVTCPPAQIVVGDGAVIFHVGSATTVTVALPVILGFVQLLLSVTSILVFPGPYVVVEDGFTVILFDPAESPLTGLWPAGVTVYGGVPPDKLTCIVIEPPLHIVPPPLIAAPICVGCVSVTEHCPNTLGVKLTEKAIITRRRKYFFIAI
jgi:hypothetical protein